MLPASDIVESHWAAERRGLERFHTEQPPYSLLNRSIEREVLPTAQRHGTDIGTPDQAHVPPGIELPDLRRRHIDRRAAV